MKRDQDNSSSPPPRDGNRRLGKKPPLPSYRRGPFSWLIVAIIVFTIMMMLQQGLATNTLRWDEFRTHLEQGDIERIDIGDTQIVGKFRKEEAPDPKSLSFQVNYRPESAQGTAQRHH